MADGDTAEHPRITVVTPSFNQARFLEATIRSVLLQGYPNLEYLVVDGGSTDGSVEILEKYDPWIDHWVSEPDRGQSHAINKGFRRATGEILAWLNSDDTYVPWTLEAVSELMSRNEAGLVLGAMDKVDVTGSDPRFLKRSTPHRGVPLHPMAVFSDGSSVDFHFFQPSLFWRREVWEVTGGLDERYEYVMDVEWCSRALAAGASLLTSDVLLSRFAVHPEAKTQARVVRQKFELASMYLRLSGHPGFRRWRTIACAAWPLRQAFSRMASDPARSRVAGGICLQVARGLKLLCRLMGGGQPEVQTRASATAPATGERGSRTG